MKWPRAEQVAIKKLPHRMPKDMKKNVNEIRLLRRCQNPNVVTLMEAYLLEDQQEVWVRVRASIESNRVESNCFEQARGDAKYTDWLIGFVYWRRGIIARW